MTYADDTQIYFFFDAENYNEAQDILNTELKNLYDDCQKDNLNLNPNNSCLMLFGNKNKIETLKNILNIKINKTKLTVL